MVLERFVLRCRGAGIINDEVVRKVRASTINQNVTRMLIIITQALLDFQIKFTLQMPSRGRKRFVSEGDGGLVKETSWSVLSSCWLSLNFGTCISHVLELAFLMFNIFQVMGELGKKRCWLFVNNFHSEGKAYVYQWSRAQWRSCFQKWYRLYILFAPENGSVSNFKGDSNHCVATELVNISDYFVKDLAKVVFPDFVPFNYCKIETNCDPTKFDFEFYCIHTKLCIYWWLFTESWKYTKTELNS